MFIDFCSNPLKLPKIHRFSAGSSTPDPCSVSTPAACLDLGAEVSPGPDGCGAGHCAAGRPPGVSDLLDHATLEPWTTAVTGVPTGFQMG